MFINKDDILQGCCLKNGLQIDAMMNQLNEVTVYAPATSANCVVGFDILGFAVNHLGDSVTLKKTFDQNIQIDIITSSEEETYEIEKMIVLYALQSMLDYLQLRQGISLSIQKNIPSSSGMGGTAASSVAALVALNRMLKAPLNKELLATFALDAQRAISGTLHGDNIIPCLFGGLTLIQSLEPMTVIQLPIIHIYIVLVHPHLHLDMRDSRSVLQQKISLESHIRQSARLASFVSALYENNYQKLHLACVDLLIEPMRAHLIPNFHEVQMTAYQSGALGCSISGAGPTLLALAETSKIAVVVAKSMGTIFNNNGIQYDSYITTISEQGAKIIDEK